MSRKKKMSTQKNLCNNYLKIKKIEQYGGELFSDYVAKPVTIDCLAATVRRTIDRHQAERQRSTA